ncbi:hypothetical protein CEXT_274391 [Caerostris extrusa]|uniref:Uncharacterized protein n=1 Tax=Caerostris extrusa TaxID=172846 RepID=A0AAV4P2S5_CAEEX|nr:hypothetical protein CEXT_274391 [Caerostris extrusa]
MINALLLNREDQSRIIPIGDVNIARGRWNAIADCGIWVSCKFDPLLNWKRADKLFPLGEYGLAETKLVVEGFFQNILTSH